MEIISSTLGKKTILEEIKFILSFFQKHNNENIMAFYGWGCDTEELYKDIEIKLNKLQEFIKDSQVKGIYTLGDADLFLSDPNEKYQFLLCHESDIHFKSDDLKLLKEVQDSWQSKGYKAYEAKKYDAVQKLIKPQK